MPAGLVIASAQMYPENARLRLREVKLSLPSASVDFSPFIS